MALHLNAMHLIQTLDGSVFIAIKSKWKEVDHEWQIINLKDAILKKKDFAPTLKTVLESLSVNKQSIPFKITLITS